MHFKSIENEDAINYPEDNENDFLMDVKNVVTTKSIRYSNNKEDVLKNVNLPKHSNEPKMNKSLFEKNFNFYAIIVNIIIYSIIVMLIIIFQ